MSFPPLLHAPDVDRSVEVAAVLVFIKPLALTCSLGGFAAFGLAAIPLMPDVAGVRKEEIMTALASALSDLFCH
jgi:hypothetical protein